MKEKEILEAVKSKLGIEQLNPMQIQVLKQTPNNSDIMLLSPTGSGKTLAFIMPMLKAMKDSTGKVQAIVIAPSRELVIQIDNVIRSMSTGYKVTVCYGGHNVLDEKQSLSVTPDIIVSTPGRLVDHINRHNIDIYSTRILVLDEFDKSLELGFHEEMKKIIKKVPNVAMTILTSATAINEMPEFIKLRNLITHDFLSDNANLRERLKIWNVESEGKDKLEALYFLLGNISQERTIIFANHRDSVERIFDYLNRKDISVGLYHGGMDQTEREKAIALFNNGSFMILVTTDLGSRGLDIAEVSNIIHYHIPTTGETFTHRNGRSARISASGEIFVITAPEEKIPEYIEFDYQKELNRNLTPNFSPKWKSIYFQAGKKEKISKGDIVGFILSHTELKSEEIGAIDLKDHYALVGVPSDKVDDIIKIISSHKIKNKKVRVSIARQ